MSQIIVKLSELPEERRNLILSQLDNLLDLLQADEFISFNEVTPDNVDTLVATFDNNQELVSLELKNA